MPMSIIEDAALYLEGRPNCDCGECLDCYLRGQNTNDEFKTNHFQNQNSKGSQMQSKNQQISEKFVHGPEYLAEWNRDVKLRQEFDGDFDAYCHYQAAYSKGLVKTFGGRR